MLPLFFCIYRRQQPSPLTIIPLHCHHPQGSYARRIFRLLWAATWWTSGHRDVKSPLCSKGSFPLFLLWLCLSGYLQCQCRADRICRDIHAANNVLWEKSVYPTPFCYLRPCVSFFGVPYLGSKKRTCLRYSYCPASVCSATSHTQLMGEYSHKCIRHIANRGVLANLRKATARFVMSVCPSARPFILL